MGTLHPRPLLCERTRGWASHALDGELSEFERALMQVHLARCPDCAAFVEDVGVATAALRSTEPEPLAHAIALPVRTRRVGVGALRLGAVAAVFVGALGLAGSLTVDPGPAPGSRIQASGASDFANELLLREVQRTALTPVPPPNRRGKVLLPL
jgi:predicted anti-sigma-YlaC factor YlaD